jgi:L-glutamine-phosphate cytidylyltransferase
MKAIILAAGRGSRMKELTEEVPKCLLEIEGKALLDRQIESLKGAGIDEIAIVTGYKRELLIDRGLFEFNNPRWAETNMVSSLACCEEWLEDDICIVSYSDIFYDSGAVLSLIQDSAELAVTYDPNWLKLWTSRFGDPLLDAETFRMDENSFLAEIGNEPSSIDQVEGQYMGLLRFTPKGWEKVVGLRTTLSPKECDSMHMTGTLQKLIESKQVAIKAIPYEGKWGEFDSEVDIKLYEKK